MFKIRKNSKFCNFLVTFSFQHKAHFQKEVGLDTAVLFFLYHTRRQKLEPNDH